MNGSAPSTSRYHDESSSDCSSKDFSRSMCSFSGGESSGHGADPRSEEYQQYLRRRRSNNEASRRCRMIRREREKQVHQEVYHLQKKNADLRNNVELLEKLVKKVKVAVSHAMKEQKKTLPDVLSQSYAMAIMKPNLSKISNEALLPTFSGTKAESNSIDSPLNSVLHHEENHIAKKVIKQEPTSPIIKSSITTVDLTDSRSENEVIDLSLQQQDGDWQQTSDQLVIDLSQDIKLENEAAVCEKHNTVGDAEQCNCKESTVHILEERQQEHSDQGEETRVRFVASDNDEISRLRLKRKTDSFLPIYEQITTYQKRPCIDEVPTPTVTNLLVVSKVAQTKEDRLSTLQSERSTSVASKLVTLEESLQSFVKNKDSSDNLENSLEVNSYPVKPSVSLPAEISTQEKVLNIENKPVKRRSKMRVSIARGVKYQCDKSLCKGHANGVMECEDINGPSDVAPAKGDIDMEKPSTSSNIVNTETMDYNNSCAIIDNIPVLETTKLKGAVNSWEIGSTLINFGSESTFSTPKDIIDHKKKSLSNSRGVSAYKISEAEVILKNISHMKGDNIKNCTTCNIAFDRESLFMVCQCCCKAFCTECLNWTVEKYRIIQICINDVVWFCKTCKVPVMEAILTEQTLEKLCGHYFSGISEKLQQIVQKVSTKAEDAEVQQIKADLSSLKCNFEKMQT